MQKRTINFEVLRVLSMALIVLTHLLGHGTTHDNVGPIHVSFTNGYILNAFAYPFLAASSSLGVICFVLISGYFMCSCSTLRFDKVAKTWLITFFYSFGLALLLYVMNVIPGTALLRSLFPIGTDQYWFVTKYMALLLMAPFLAVLIRYLTQRGLLILLGVLGCLTVTITHGIPYGNVFFSDNPLSVAIFVFIFFISAYIRFYNMPVWVEKYCLHLFLALLAIQGLGGILINYMYISNNNLYACFSGSNNGLSLIPAVALFIWIKNHKFNPDGWAKRVAQIAPYTFAVYLVHDNPYISSFLWNHWVDCAIYWSSPIWLLLAIIIPLVVLFIGCAIDGFRAWIFKICRIDRVIDKVKSLNLEVLE